MRSLRAVLLRLFGFFRWRRDGREFNDELESHLQFHIEENLHARMSPAEARRHALLKLGGLEQTKLLYRDRRSSPFLETLLRDLRYAFRMLRKNFGFTVTVVLTLALSIGANTAIFSLVNAILLKGLPYAHPERIGTIYARTTGSSSEDGRRNIDGEQWERLRDDVPSLVSAVSGLRAAGMNLQAGSQVQYLHAGRVSAHYFDVLALQPMIGRSFSEGEDRPQGPEVALLTYALWRTSFGGDPSVLGQAILLRGEPYTVIGVLPENALSPLNADLYIPLQPSREGEGRATNFTAIIRLRDGATWQQADAELGTAFAQTQRFQRLARSGARATYYSVPLQKAATEALRPQILALMLAAGFILFIACANLAGLTLVRISRRTGEFATRLALGASSWQIQRQLWVENLLLALFGGTAGATVGFLALRSLLLLLPEHFLPVANVPLDGLVLAFALFLTLLTSVLFGMLPALTTGESHLRSSMGNRAVIGGGSVRLRQWLISGEVALTVVLLAACGLIIHTLIHLETLPPGFNPHGVLAAKASLDNVRYHDPANFRNLLSDSLVAMRQIPGVQDAAVGLSLPYERSLINGVSLSQGKGAGQPISTEEIYVTPSYFATLQIPVLAGRVFDVRDNLDGQRVVVVNEVFARKFLHESNPVGQYLNRDNRNVLIVGVVAATVASSASRLTADPAPLTSVETIYVPAAQLDDGNSLAILHTWFQPSWIVRAAGPTEGLTAQMQLAVASVDPNLPFSGFYDMNDLMATQLSTQRVEVALLTAMASLALLLSAVGIFALVANLVAQRTRELGIRMALGSTAQAAMIHVGRLGVGASGLGLVLGLILCAAALPALRSTVYGIRVYDTPTILVVILMLAAVTLLATIVPALKVARIDPARTLREE